MIEMAVNNQIYWTTYANLCILNDNFTKNEQNIYYIMIYLYFDVFWDLLINRNMIKMFIKNTFIHNASNMIISVNFRFGISTCIHLYLIDI